MNDDDETVMDYQIESQRGAFIFGYPYFSSQALLPCDPAPFSSLDGNPIGPSIDFFQVPNNEWEWAQSTWYVDMSGDVDYYGWTYSWRFGSTHWHGTHKTCRGFVRRRIWSRLRVRRKVDKGTLPHADLIAFSNKCNSPNLDFLKSCRNEREVSEAIVKRLNEHPEELPQLLKAVPAIVKEFKFPASTESLFRKLQASSEACQEMAKAINSQLIRGSEESLEKMFDIVTEQPTPCAAAPVGTADYSRIEDSVVAKVHEADYHLRESLDAKRHTSS